MDAFEFLKEAKRYCRWCKNTTQDGKKRLCEVCYFENLNDIFNLHSMAYRKFVETVEQWTKEHPVKTRQSELLKLFPDASVLYDEYLNICPAQLSSECRDKETGGCYDPGMDCGKCKRDFWLKEIE